MRISDWSSDVCSSDLGEWELVASKGDQSTGSRKILLMDMVHQAREMPWWQWVAGMGAGQVNVLWPTRDGMVPWGRSEERRVGKGWVSTFRTRWSADH